MTGQGTSKGNGASKRMIYRVEYNPRGVNLDD